MWVAHTSTSFVVSFSTLWWQSLKATRINFIKNNFFLLFVYTSAKRGVYLIKFYSDECLCWRQWERVHWNEEGDKNLMSSLMYHHHHHSWNCWIIKLSSKWNIMYTCVIYTTFSSSHISHIHLWNNCIRFFFFLCIYQKKNLCRMLLLLLLFFHQHHLTLSGVSWCVCRRDFHENLKFWLSFSRWVNLWVCVCEWG